MGTNKRRQPGTVVGGFKEHFKRASRPNQEEDVSVPQDLVIKRPLPVVKSRHRSYFEFVENTDKKKKLEYKETFNTNPPHGFQFVPVGNPELTNGCKELSRENGLMIYIVSTSNSAPARSLATQMSRVGYHFHAAIVREARSTLSHLPDLVVSSPDGAPEPIPESQELYHSQVDAILRDLFPRIPHTDRQIIIRHSFTRGVLFHGEKPVGLTEDVPLCRRVQLAVLAHVRHNHTTYDDLLKRLPWMVTRKAIQPACLDVLVKWRGDEESGRDQLDEILREVVIISDSEDDDSDVESTDGTSVEEVVSSNSASRCQSFLRAERHHRANQLTSSRAEGAAVNATGVDRKARRGFDRYRRAWEEAVQRNGDSLLDAAGSVHDHDASTSHALHDASGNAPTANGYVPRSLQAYGQPSGRSTMIPNGPYHEAELLAREQAPMDPGSRHPWHPLGSATQDMLVRSVEPAPSEAGQQSFITGPFPRPGTRLEHHSVHQHQSMQYYSGRSPSPAQAPDNSSPAWRIMHRTDGLLATSSAQTSAFRRDQCGVATPVFAMPSLPARVHEAPASVAQPTAERIVVNTARPGSRSNPIVMEDRGGFFERVGPAESPKPRQLHGQFLRSPAQGEAPMPRRALTGSEPVTHRSSGMAVPFSSHASSWGLDRRPGRDGYHQPSGEGHALHSQSASFRRQPYN